MKSRVLVDPVAVNVVVDIDCARGSEDAAGVVDVPDPEGLGVL
jgi:hypothetical protein